MKKLTTFVLFIYSFMGISLAQHDYGKNITADKNADVESGSKKPVVISQYYKRGSYLLYDCDEGHFACVDDVSFDKCKKWRQKAIDEMSDYMPCAPLKKFKTDELCNKAHYKFIETHPAKRFCIRLKKGN